MGNSWSRFEGQFKGDKKQGEGKYFFVNGDEFIGNFKNDQAEGEGIYINRQENCRIDGIWKNNILIITK